MDKERFDWACRTAAEEIRERSSIGTLSEKSLHAALKLYFEPHSDCQEINVGDFVADIVGEQGIIEIQTRSLSKMKKKLEKILSVAPVTVVHPITVNKRVICVDENTGAVTSKRKSPKHGDIYSAFEELWGIREYLGNENLTVCLLLIDVEEIRIYGGEVPKYGRKKQRSPKGYFRSDRIPTALHDEIYLNRIEDFRVFIPDGLPDRFTVKIFAGKANIPNHTASWGLHLMSETGVVERVGKQGNAYLYEMRINK